MRKLFGILRVLACFVVSPESIVAQQASVAFAQPIGIQAVRERAADDTTRRHSASEETGPSRSAFVVGGAVVGGLAAGGWMVYGLYKHVSHGGEVMINPVPIIAGFAGCGMIVGGLIGLSIYYGSHPKT